MSEPACEQASDLVDTKSMQNCATVKFTVIIPTRNRPEDLQTALASVFRQSFDDFDVVVIDDGSDAPHQDVIASQVRCFGGRVSLLRLPQVPRGHGPAYARNCGVAHAKGDYVCFLDDDDVWTDPDFLARVADVAIRAPRPLDLHLTDQVAYRAGERLDRIIWTEDLKPIVQQALQPDAAGAYEVTADLLLRSHGFCHLNTTVARRAFFLELGGFDENLRYEEDRDFYLRAIDAAGLIKYSPIVTSRHNVPNPSLHGSVSTKTSDISRRIYQLRLLDKAILFSRQPRLRAYGKRHKVHTLKQLAEDLWRRGDSRAAVFYARQALGADVTLKWLAFCIWISSRALIRRLPSASLRFHNAKSFGSLSANRDTRALELHAVKPISKKLMLFRCDSPDAFSAATSSLADKRSSPS